MVNGYLQAVDLRKDLKNGVLFSGVNFEVFVKNWILITGVPGSGKTTLLEILAGKQKPDFGHVERKRHLRELLIARNYLTRKKTIYQNLISIGKKLGLNNSQIENKINKLGAKFQIEEYLQQNINTLPDSVHQLGILMQGLMTPVDLLMIDEPLIFLGQKEIKTFMQNLRDLHSKGTAIIIVANDISHFIKSSTDIYQLKYSSFRLQNNTSFHDLMRPHLIFEAAKFAEPIPDYVLANTLRVKRIGKTIDIVTTPDEVNELTLELLKRGYSIKYLRKEII